MVRPGDRVRFDGKVHTVIGLSGVLVRLADEHGHSSAMHSAVGWRQNVTTARPTITHFPFRLSLARAKGSFLRAVP